MRIGLLFPLLLATLLASTSLSPAQSVTPPWTFAKAVGNVAYFVTSSPNQVKRYDMQAGKWVNAIDLAEAPTAFTADADGLYIAFGRRVSYFTLTGVETHLKNTPSNILGLLSDATRLFLVESNTISIIQKLDGIYLDSKSFFYSMTGLSIAPSLNKIFGRSTGISPSDILSITVDNAGKLGSQVDSPYHGAYPNASQTYVFPGDARVADNSGIVYNTANLTYNNSLGGAFTDMAFWNGLPILLRGGKIIALSATFGETGQITPASAPSRIFVCGDKIFAFGGSSASGIQVATFDISQLNVQTPGQAIDPAPLAYIPDAVEKGPDEVVYLLSRKNLSIFRWSVPLNCYLPTIPLTSAPSYMAVHAPHKRLYLAYPSGQITYISTVDPALKEVHFANLPQSPQGLAAAGNYLFACDPSGAWVTHYVYNDASVLVSQKDWNYYSQEYIWSTVNQKLYFFRDDTTPNDIIWEPIDGSGKIGAYKDSPYHGDYPIVHPIRLSPDGSVVLLGSGHIYDALTLELKDSLSNNISDAAWQAGRLFTIRPAILDTQIQIWDSRYAMVKAKDVPGSPLRLMSTPEDLLLLVNVNGTVRFRRFNATDLSPIANESQLVGGTYSVYLAPGCRTTATLRIKNTGALSWVGGSQPGAYRLAVVSDPDRICQLTQPWVSIPAGVVVKPGEEYEFSVEVLAPAAANGLHSADLRMTQANGEAFGSMFKLTVTNLCATSGAWRIYQ